MPHVVELPEPRPGRGRDAECSLARRLAALPGLALPASLLPAEG